jgi:CheY-like chemotaxis protein
MGSTKDSPQVFDQPIDQADLAAARILVVDDNPQNLELMYAYLEGLGCQLQTAEDGVVAMELIGAKAPDLVLLDVMMPRMSGFEVCRKIKANPTTRDVVVIMVTALNEVADFERAVECGTNDFIAKPVNKHELLTRVKSLLQLSLLKRQFDQIGSGASDGGDASLTAADVPGLLDQGDTIVPPPPADDVDGD